MGFLPGRIAKFMNSSSDGFNIKAKRDRRISERQNKHKPPKKGVFHKQIQGIFDKEEAKTKLQSPEEIRSYLHPNLRKEFLPQRAT